MKLSIQDQKLLSRHFIKIKIFGYVFTFWNTSPERVLKHLKEVQQSKE